MDYFSNVPKEVLWLILRNFNDPTELVPLLSVNKRFHKLCQEDDIWKPFYEKIASSTTVL
jgi:hypothetical protein